MHPTRRSLCLALLFAACGDAGETNDAGTTSATNISTGKTSSTGEQPTSQGDSSSASESSTGDPGAPAGLELMQRLAGLWTGPATMTPSAPSRG
jgi:hypothetical protein